MDTNQKKKFAAGLSIISNVVLTILKIVAGAISGNLSIISEAIHSLSDFFASMITFISVVKSSKPADKDHPYGHGKYEDMAGFIEGLLIILAAIFIVYKSCEKIATGLPTEYENSLGIAVMIIAVITNYIISTILFRIAKSTNSIALHADGEHLRTDVFSSVGVLLGLYLIKITGHTILDPVIAILVAGFIYKTGYKISKKAWMNLLDHSLPKTDIENINNIIKNFSHCAKLKHNGIKARQVGPTKDIDLILQFPEQTPICECHKICDAIEKQILALYTNSSISIHSEPLCYKKDCQNSCKNHC